jgi:hypothetical protein
MSAKYCCDEMEKAVSQQGGRLISHNENGTFSISGCDQCYVITDATYCPWCGASQKRHAKRASANQFPKNLID